MKVENYRAITEAQIIIKSSFANRITRFGVYTEYTILKSFCLKITVGGDLCFA